MTDSNGAKEPFPRDPGVRVRAFLADGTGGDVWTSSDADGFFGFCVLPGTTLYYEPVKAGQLRERHAVTMTTSDCWMDLDMRDASTVGKLAALARRAVKPGMSAVTVELIGRRREGGERVIVEPHVGAPFVYDKAFNDQWKVIDTDTLQPDASMLVIYPDVAPGPFKVRIEAPPGEVCKLLAFGLETWKMEPDLNLQVDAVCTPVAAAKRP